MSPRETILLTVLLVLAASNLVLLVMLCGCLGEKRIAEAPPSLEAHTKPGEQSSSSGTASDSPRFSTSLNVNNSLGGETCSPPVSASVRYVDVPVTYYLSIEAVSSFELDPGAAPRIPENLAISVVKLEGSPSMCAVDMEAGVEAGVAAVNVTIPLPGGCYRVEPVLMNRTASEVYFRLALVEDPAGACGRCARITLRVSYLPPGRYIVSVGPVLQRG